MNSYLEILKEKALKVGAPIEQCDNDLECMVSVISQTISKNLENEPLEIILKKAKEINVDISNCSQDKVLLLEAIVLRVGDVLEEEYHEFLKSSSNLDAKHLFNPLDPFSSNDINDLA